MLIRRLALLTRPMGRASIKDSISKRTLYTNSIYPYPSDYITTKKFPGQCVYRENTVELPWEHKEATIGIWMFRLFWFYFFISLFNDPGVILGHNTFPDPSAWTDEELGIPPIESGSYKTWLENKQD